jgi:hypothetical protein
MSALALGFPGVAVTSLLMVGLSPAVGDPPEASVCTAVIERDFTTDAGPIYPVASQPNYWRDPDWLPLTFFPPGEAAWPEVAIVENADVVAGELTYLTDPTYSTVILGDIATNATDFLPAFDAYGGNREIDVEVDVNFHADLYAADQVATTDGIGRIVSLYSESTAWRFLELAAVDADGPPSGTVVLRLTYCIGAGSFTSVTVATKARTWADGLHNIKIKALPSTPQVPGSTINHTLNNNGRIRVWIDDVLEYEGASLQFRPAVAFKTQINDAYVVSALGLGHYSFVGGYTYVRLGYCDVPDPPEPPEPPTPGGELPEAIEPLASDLPTGILRVFALMTYGIGEVKSELGVGETTMRDPASWYGGFKPGWLLELSDIERTLSTQLQGVTVTLTVADPGGLTFRALAETTRLIGAIWEIFVVSDEVRYALGEPHRRFAGRVIACRALPGFRYEFTLLDILSADLGRFDQQALVPPGILTPAHIPTMTAEYVDKAVQMVLGEVSDESEVTPVGVIPPRIIAPSVNLTYFGGVNVLAVPAIISHGAAAAMGAWKGYFNTKTDPYTRHPIPASAWATIMTAPGQAGWNYVGVATDYIDFPQPLSALTHRLTVMFFLASHPLVQAWVNKEIQVAFNGYGLTENADGTGRYFTDAPDIYDFITRIYLAPDVWRTGEYPDHQTFFRGYSVVNHASVVRTRERLRAFGGGTYPIGLILGADGQQQTGAHVLDMICDDMMMEQGTDRHGRRMLDVEDPDAEATFSVSDLHDIENGTFEVSDDGRPVRNNARYRSGFRYLPAVGPLPAPAEGETMPEVNLGEHQEWTSIGLYTLDAAVTANDGKLTPPLELYLRSVRRSDVALNVAQRKVARLCGPAPGYNGARLAQQTTTWRRGALAVELGDVGAITHIEGTGTGGYVGRRFRVESIRDSLLARRISFAGRILPAGEAT